MHQKFKIRTIRVIVALCLSLVFTQCDRTSRLAQAPNILVGLGAYPDAEIPVQLRTTTPRIYFMTDRQPIASDNNNVEYGVARSPSMAFGYKTISFGSDLTWDELKQRSVSQALSRQVRLDVLEVRELVRFPPTPLPFSVRNGRALISAEANRAYQKAAREFKAAVREALSRANRREVLIYVHGIRNDFKNGAATLSNLWHFSGRTGVPIVYTWPADNPGLFGYFSDRESGEFSVYHFKEFMRLLAEIPELERINLIAHSQGSDITTTALREMIIAARAAGKDPRNTLKIDTLILAAPDLNFDVVGQRLAAEHFATAFQQVVIYINSSDRTLGFAQQILPGVRLGRLSYDDLDEDQREQLSRVGNLHFVNVEAVAGRESHSYFRKNPDVVSDIVITLRTGAAPGGNERPLERFADNFWNLHAGYPFGRPKAVFATDQLAR